MSKWITNNDNIKSETEIKVETDLVEDFENFQNMHTTISIVSTSGAETLPQIQRPVISVKDFRMPSAPSGVVSSSTSSPSNACMRPPPPPGPPRPPRASGYVEVKQERVERERHPHEEPSSSIPDLGKIFIYQIESFLKRSNFIIIYVFNYFCR